MWIDSDTMIINPTFQLPLNKFAGKDLIIWGNETALLAGDGRSGMEELLFPMLLIEYDVLSTSMLAPDVVIVVGASSPDGSRRDVHCVLCRALC